MVIFIFVFPSECHISPAAFKVFCLLLVFRYFVIICFGMALFVFLAWLHWDSWIFEFSVFLKFGKHSAIFFKYFLLFPNYRYIRHLGIVPQITEEAPDSFCSLGYQLNELSMSVRSTINLNKYYFHSKLHLGTFIPAI